MISAKQISLIVPLAILLALVVVAVAAPVLTSFNPVASDLAHALRPPSWTHGGSPEHLLGTDRFGRDVLSRVIYGARVSLSVAAISILISTTIGTLVGLTAGYVGGWLDSLLMRITDMILVLPTILLALAISVAVGPSFTNLVLVIGLLLWPRTARLVRGEVLVLNESEFMRYAGAIEVPGWLIVFRHVLPNVLPVLLVASTLEIGHIILIEASLSFLGAGIPAPQPSWGVMISDGRALIATGWWIALFPGVAIVLTVISFSALGDQLRDRLDPRLRLV